MAAALAASRAPARALSSAPQDKCAACGMEKDSVPEGMKQCSKCFQVPYCSSDCMEWHWESGGHKHECAGATAVEKQKRTTPKASRRSSDTSIDPFGGGDTTGPQSKEEMAAALSQMKSKPAAAPTANTLQAAPRSSVPMDRCKSCGMDAEFVSEGMKVCSKCHAVCYCSLDCMSWDWDRGGHKDTCSGPVKAKRQLSIKKSMPTTARNRKCKACSMEEEFVPEGMKTCPRCSLQVYCSDDCLQWDWQHGDHQQLCPGASGADRIIDREISMASQDDISDTSIDAFGEEAKIQAPPPQQQSAKAAAKSSPSLRDQITGGNDVSQERQIYSEVLRAPAQNIPVNTLKLELGRLKRQYNDAMLSKASLKRDLSARSGDALPERNRDGFRDAVESFLSRLDDLIGGAEPASRSQEKGRSEMREGGLEEKVADLESTIRSLVAQQNEATEAGAVPRSALNSRRAPGPSGLDRNKNGLLKELNDKWEEILAESDALKVQLDHAAGERERLLATNAASTRALQDTEDTLSKVCGAIVELEKEVLRIVQEQRKLEVENETLRKQLDHAHDEHEQLTVAKDASDKLVDEKDGLISKLCKAIEDLEAEVSRTGTEKQTLETELSRTKLMLAKHRQARNKLEQSFQNAEDELQGIRRHIQEMGNPAEAAFSSGHPAGKYTYPDPASNTRSRAPDLPSFLRQTKAAAAIPTTRTSQHNQQAAQPPLSREQLPEKSVFSTFSMPSQRQDDLGRAIRERTSGAPLPGRAERYRATTALESSRLPRGLAGAGYRDDAQEPVGNRIFEDYQKPMKRQVERQRQSEPAIAKHHSYTPQSTTPAPWTLQDDTATDARGLDGIMPLPSKPIKQPEQEVVGTHKPTTVNDRPTKGADIIVQLPLTPTEQRMAYIQHRIAEAVDSAKQKAAPSEKRSLRPQYGRATQANQSSRVGSQPLAAPSSRFGPGAQPSSRHHSAPRVSLPSLHEGSPQAQFPRLVPNTGVGANRQRVAEQTTPRKSNRQQQQPQHPRQHQGGLGGPPTNRTRLDPSGGYRDRPATSDAAQPRYSVTLQMDPQNLQKDRNNRWRGVLTSSKVLG